jgi:hypothetical protein
MTNNKLLLIAVFVPVAGAFLLPIIGRFSEKFRNGAAFIKVAAVLAEIMP